MKTFFKNHLITIAIAVVGVLIISSVLLSFYNKRIMREALETKEQTALVMSTVEKTFLNIRNMDISSRGYAIMGEERYLYWTVEIAQETNRENFRTLDSLFREQGFSYNNYRAVKAGFEKYVLIFEDMLKYLRAGDIDGYKTILTRDFGKDFFLVTIAGFMDELAPFETALAQRAEDRYESAILRNSVLQLLLFIIGIPTLALIVTKLRRDEKRRDRLLSDLRENNQKYVFNDGEEDNSDAESILNNSIANFKKAANYVDKVSQSDYTISWQGLNEKNELLNNETLAGRLRQMKLEMQKGAIENDKRIWLTEGISELSEIIRNSEQDLTILTYEATQYLCKRLKAQQAALFVFQKEHDDDAAYLELKAAYAFNRKKYIEKKLDIGQGLVGQAFKEQDTIMLTEIPSNYHHLQSGLGDSTPGFIIVVPMKYNDQIQAVIEMASFEEMAPYMVDFLEKAGEYIASAIATAKNNERTKIMLERLQSQAEEMRAQEEELRQNMEELEATQEEMRRKERITEQKIKEQQL